MNNKEFKKTILMGGFDNRPVWADITVTFRNGYQEFACCFNEGKAFNINEIDYEYMYNYYENLFYDMDETWKLHFLEDGYYNLQEAIEHEIHYNTTDYHDIVECSSTDLEITLDDDVTINFESTCGGQHDIRKDKSFNAFIFTNKDAVTRLLEMWDEFHLKEIDDTIYNEVIEICNNLEGINEEEFIKNNIIFEEVL